MRTVIIIMLLSSCSIQKQNKSLIKSKVEIKTLLDDYSKNVGYNLLMKPGYSYKKSITGKALEEQFIFEFQDSSIIYISNNVIDGSMLNFKNRLSININRYDKKHMLDTITISGIQENGNYWKEKLNGEICIGYKNVNASTVKIYDTILGSVKKIDK